MSKKKSVGKLSWQNGLLAIGALSGLVTMWNIRRVARKQVAELKAELTAATMTKNFKQVASVCDWTFRAPVFVEKGISQRMFLSIDKLDKLTTEFFSDGNQVVLKILPAKSLWINLYLSPLSRFAETDFDFRDQPSYTAWDLLQAITRTTMKLQWVQVVYQRQSDTLTIILQFETSVGTFLAAKTALQEVFASFDAVITQSPRHTNRFEVVKNKFLVDYGNVEELYAFVYYLKYAHMASPELFHALAMRLPPNDPWYAKLQKLRQRTTTKCRLVPSDSIELEKPT